MAHSLKEIAGSVVATLSDEERRKSVVYFDPRLLENGAAVSVRGTTLPVTAPSFMAFVDLEPASNWSHPCRYLLVNREDGSIVRVDAQFPPASESLRLIHRGEGVDDWMLLTNARLD